ncbi:glycosyltransferase [Aristaeella lactis]|uniref:Glycosyltransferase involved in cell wall bisynthesis n=1 Tax=Aristaeella lactis TaxID=3046383 RepID=A0AC61PJ61_9FIRM|nr:glycosyltransferase [Aristaeella lactis]QUA54041.1 glycosyltransferase [Aristaeella lactis]SMC42682.1 Glycosyltransferase involved in cell wall bisynthesis [Aristaeella lactis]
MREKHVDILYINTVDYGSTGKIMKQMSAAAELSGYKTCCAIAGEKEKKNNGCLIISSYTVRRINELFDRVFSVRGYDSFLSTLIFLRKLDRLNPRIIHLHNLHSNYINLPLLFRYIKKRNIKIIWTLHDCWAFTGRCPHFVALSCEKWKDGCKRCIYPTECYPIANHDRSAYMWKQKKKWFTGVKNLTIVTPSQWLEGLVEQSFLNCYPIKVVTNGIDLSIFKRTISTFKQEHIIPADRYVVLGVAFSWNNNKGLDCFIELAKRLNPEKYVIVLVGTDENVESYLPKHIISVQKTKNQQQLAEIYSVADVFVNPTRQEVLGLVNLEALACGTPVITFNTGGSPECVDETCGCVVDCNDVDGLEKQIRYICENHPFTHEMCEQRARKFCKENMLSKYLELYKIR